MSTELLPAESATPLENLNGINHSSKTDDTRSPSRSKSPKKAESPKKVKASEFKVQIPRISSREIHSQRAHSPVNELDQRDYLFIGPGSKREPNKLTVKLKNSELEECIKRAKKYAMEQSVRFVLVKQQQQQQKQQLELIKKQQALLLMCRIYVGSIFYEVKEDVVRTSFGAFGPIRSISMSWDAATNKHKGFAFIEFETPEAAQLSLEQMNGLLMGGRNIKVGRPSNMPQAQPIIDSLTQEAKNYDRIYVASIHSELSEQDVQSVFEAFGVIKTINLVRDPQTGKHKGYGFIEYESSQAAQDAISAMNLFDLGGQFLRVGKAITPPENVINPALAPLPTAVPINQPKTEPAAPKSTAPQESVANVQMQTNGSVSQNTQPTVTESIVKKEPASTPAPIPATPVSQPEPVPATVQTPAAPQQAPADHSKLELTENQKKLLGMTSADDPSASLEQQVDITLKGKEQRMILMQKLMLRKQASTILILRNMVGLEDVDEELEVEITDECEKFGEVERVVIYQEAQSEEENAEVIVKIFVEFLDPKAVDKAVEALNGRFFAGRIVKAEIYDQAAYFAKDYSG